MRYTNEELLKDIHKLTEKLGHVPSIDEYRENGEHSVTTYYNRFDSWNNAIRAAGYEPNKPQTKIPKDELLQEIQRLNEITDEKPSVPKMNKQGKYWGSTYRNRFGSWNDALEAAGFEREPQAKKVPKEYLIEDIQRVGEALNEVPTFREMENLGEYSPRTCVRQFGSWNDALVAAGYENQRRQESVSDDDLLSEITKLKSELGEVPTASDMNENGEYWTAIYQRRFGSWSAAVEKALERE